jgi:membrane-associated protease RseP (regulator of RpoE activity)
MTLIEQDAAPSTPPPPGSEPVPEGSAGRVLQLLVGVGLITAVFVLLGQGDLLLFIAILIVIVMLHELGHFATAKWAGMKVTEYFVGFGPRLWSVRKGETEYGVKAIPAGGYVRITGFTTLEEVAEEDEPRAYRQQPFHQRIIVASAGSVMHVLIALVLAVILVVSFGKLTNNYTITSVEHWPGVAQTPAALAGLRPGDTIVSINGKTFANPNSMTDVIRNSTGKQLELGVERDGRLIHVHATPKSGKGVTIGGQSLGDGGHLGIGIQQATASVGLLGAISNSFDTLWQVTDATFAGIGHTFSASGLSSVYHQVTNPKAAQQAADNPVSSDRPSSLIGITDLGAQSVHDGIASVLLLLIAVNLGFAIINMLPMIPLDGGHVAIAAYEWIRTRRGQPYYRADITKLFPVAAVFIGLLGMFVVATMYLDITHPIQLPH